MEDLNKLMKNKLQYLTEEQHNELLKVLPKLKYLLMEHLVPGKQIQNISNEKKMINKYFQYHIK